MIKEYSLKAIVLAMVVGVCTMVDFQGLQAQVTGPQEIKWLWVGSLRHWFSSASSEIEYGRRGRGPYLNTDQDDGLRWPAQYQYQDHNVGKGLWIGTTNFADPVSGQTYTHKVICLGRPQMYTDFEVFPVEFRLIGRFSHPIVTVDNVPASDLDLNDLNLSSSEDLIDPNLPADRMIYNRVNTPIGITIYRKVLAFAQQYNDNYFIYEWVFKNTGLIDNSGTVLTPARTLTGVIFHFQYRFADNNEGYRLNWSYFASSWGRNTINDVVGQDAAHTLPAPNDFRASFAYYGPMYQSSGVMDDIGAPNPLNGSILGGSQFVGEVVLHADASPNDPTDDPTQPHTTWYQGSDNDAQDVTVASAYTPDLMDRKWGFMTRGHAPLTHAEAVGEDANGWPSAFANNYSAGSINETGGYSSVQAFGPYNLAPGDSVRIVIAEAVAGISRAKNIEVARNWWTWVSNSRTGTTDLQLPAGPPPGAPPTAAGNIPYGGTTTDGNIYKAAWVFTGKDSLFQTFRRAIANYQGGYNIPKAPPPPDRFMVTSQGSLIKLSWSASAETWPNFNGYLIYRAEGKTDTVFNLIASFDKSDLPTLSGGMRTYEDKTPKRGFNYYYYIQTKDNGLTNTVEQGVPLTSSMFYTMTNQAAYLRRPPGNSLSEIRVVPNPYNIKAAAIQFGTSSAARDRLAFFGLPPYCLIKIYTETGDLIQTIDHNTGTGDELWHSLTSSNQLVVSGLYIAYFEVTQDFRSEQTGQLIYRKGDNTFRKFIIIR
jgi:hypothetical protein